MFLKKIYAPLQQALEENGLEKPFPVQKKMIAAIKSGSDLLAISEDGKGKTSALVIAAIQVLKEEKDDVPRMLVLVPDNTRLETIEALFRQYASHTTLRIRTAPTRGNILDQKDAIYFGSDIVIGVPERISELMSIEGINISDIRHIAIDDSTESMRQSTASYIHRILESFPKAQLIFTGKELAEPVERVAKKFMKAPVVIR